MNKQPDGLQQDLLSLPLPSRRWVLELACEVDALRSKLERLRAVEAVHTFDLDNLRKIADLISSNGYRASGEQIRLAADEIKRLQEALDFEHCLNLSHVAKEHDILNDFESICRSVRRSLATQETR